jgi:hypothetical protein
VRRIDELSEPAQNFGIRPREVGEAMVSGTQRLGRQNGSSRPAVKKKSPVLPARKVEDHHGGTAPPPKHQAFPKPHSTLKEGDIYDR